MGTVTQTLPPISCTYEEGPAANKSLDRLPEAELTGWLITEKPRRISALTVWPTLTHCKSGAKIQASLQLHRVMFAVDMKGESKTGLLPPLYLDFKM